MTANLHAIWLDDLAPGEGSTPIWDATFADTDDETRVYLRALMTSGPVEPVSVVPEYAKFYKRIGAVPCAVDLPEPPPGHGPFAVIGDFSAPRPTPKRKKPARKPAKKSPLAAQEAKLRTVRGRLADEFKSLGDGA